MSFNEVSLPCLTFLETFFDSENFIVIESIFLANEGAYDATGTKLEGLKKLNYIFGSNGSGKTTISRVVEGTGSFSDCKISRAGGSALEARVYNRDFVEKHFDAECSIKGIYTFGENVDVAERIKELKGEADKIDAKLKGLRKALVGEDGENGKKKEQETLDAQVLQDVWDAKGKFSDLKGAFAGLNSDKKKFRDHYLREASINAATLREIAELRQDAKTVFSGTLTSTTALPDQNSSQIQALEGAEILKKKIIGKDDVDIASLIETLGNSDWVQQGRQYSDQLEDQCPFCQQKTDAAFKQSLEAYFDATYITDLAGIDRLLGDYTDSAGCLLAGYNAAEVIDSSYLDREAFEKDVAALRLALDSNVEHISAKRKEPSAPATLTGTAPLFAAVNAHIGTANAKVKANNDTIDNLAARKKELTSQIWKRLLEDTKATYDKYKSEDDALEKTIGSLNGKIEAETTNLKAKQGEIEENERKITSIKPTIDVINKLLKSFGFTNFHLAEAEDSGFYEVKRANSSDAKRTLSEGEKSFITFLYFYYLVGGSFSSSGGTNDKVVVFDDPVSSLDADILFIVCNLIKNIVAEMRSGTSPIKQVFVLTHNIYFHKEVTFDKKRSGSTARSDETFWVVRKASERSHLESFSENPIKSSYELLWREVRQKPASDTAIQNVTRRILEHYFKFYGGITPEAIIDSFEGRDKIVCSSLLSWINDGSHFAPDDLYLACDPGQVERYLAVFQRIFEESDHGGHYKMMMGDDYSPLALEDTDDVGDQVLILQEVGET
jgi:wobble nucleotide-excising tRNase